MLFILTPALSTSAKKKKSSREKHLKQKSAKGDSDKRSEWTQPSFRIRKTSPWNRPINQNLFSSHGVRAAASVNHWLHAFPPSAFLVTFQTDSCVSQTSICKRPVESRDYSPFRNVCPQDKLSTLTAVVYPQGQSLQTASLLSQSLSFFLFFFCEVLLIWSQFIFITYYVLQSLWFCMWHNTSPFCFILWESTFCAF